MADLAVDPTTHILIVTCDCKRVHTIDGNGDSFTIETKEATDGKKKESDDPEPKPEGKNPIFERTFHK